MVIPRQPFVDLGPDVRCPALGSFVEGFAAELLTKSKLEVLQCEPLLQVPEAPWLVATLAYTYGNITRILQLCVREPPSVPAAVLARTGGPCEDEYFTAFERIAAAKASGAPVDDLPHALIVESDPELAKLETALLGWLSL